MGLFVGVHEGGGVGSFVGLIVVALVGLLVGLDLVGQLVGFEVVGHRVGLEEVGHHVGLEVVGRRVGLPVRRVGPGLGFGLGICVWNMSHPISHSF